MPCVLAALYIAFISVYQDEVERRTATELENSIMELSVKRSETEITALLSAQEKNAIFRHDMRHHLTMLTNLLSENRTADALVYLGEAQDELQKISPHRFCENVSLNVLLSAFSDKAAAHGIGFSVDATVPKELVIPDMELCSRMSNALENAIHAADAVSGEKQIVVTCCIKRDKLLISVQTPYAGTVTMVNGIPTSDQPGHGFGIKSIQAIAARYNGICTFSADNGVFVVRVVMTNDLQRGKETRKTVL